MITIAYIVFGLVIGVLSGLLGIGGGVFLVPALVFLFGLTQQQAQGTSLSLFVLPVVLLGAYTYYKAGSVNINMTALIALGFILGGLIGAKYAVVLPNDILRKIFGVAMLIIAIYMIVKK